jgi:ATP synthase protein I
MSPQRKDDLRAKALRFSNLGFQMILLIGLSAWLGSWLDEYLSMKTPWLTIFLSLFGIGASFYLVFKEIKELE